MALSYFGSASNPADNGAANEPTTLAVTPPASMLAGDLVEVVAFQRLASSGSGITLNATGGQTWRLIDTFDSAAVNMSARVWTCTFNGTWDADPSWDFAAQTGTIPTSAVMHVFRSGTTRPWELDVASPVANYAAPSTPFTVTANGSTPAFPDTITLACFFSVDDNTWDTLTGTGWALTGSAQYRNTGGSDMSAVFAHNIQEGSLATLNDVSFNQATLGGDAGMKIQIRMYLPPTYFPPFPQPVYIARS